MNDVLKDSISRECKYCLGECVEDDFDPNVYGDVISHLNSLVETAMQAESAESDDAYERVYSIVCECDAAALAYAVTNAINTVRFIDSVTGKLVSEFEVEQ